MFYNNFSWTYQIQMANFIERDERCIFVGNLEPVVTEEIVWELFLQAGPLEAVHIPKDKETGVPKRFGFVSFTHEVSVPYAIKLMDGISLYGRPISVKLANQGTSSPGFQSPSNNNHGYDDTPLRRPLYDSPSERYSPLVSPHFGLSTPPPFMRPTYLQNYSSPRSVRENGSPWQPGGDRHLPRRPSPQYEHNSAYRQMYFRDNRPYR